MGSDHKLPVEYRKPQYAIRFAEKQRNVIYDLASNDSTNRRDDVCKFIKFKVEIDLHKPIVPGWTLDLGTETPIWIDFRYERLPNVCFNCERFDHESGLCPYASPNHPSSVGNEKFGVWLRAEHTAVERIMNRRKVVPSKSDQGEFSSDEMEDESAGLMKGRVSSPKNPVTNSAGNQEQSHPIKIESVPHLPELQKNPTVVMTVDNPIEDIGLTGPKNKKPIKDSIFYSTGSSSLPLQTLNQIQAPIFGKRKITIHSTPNGTKKKRHRMSNNSSESSALVNVEVVTAKESSRFDEISARDAEHPRRIQ